MKRNVGMLRAIDEFLADMRTEGRLTSASSERSYRGTLTRHAEDVENRGPKQTNRHDVKKTLARWRHPNSQRTNRAILVSFYDWLMEEGKRKDNPARQTRRPRGRPVSVYRLTREETGRVLLAARGTRERRAIFIGICAGLRSQELRGIQGRHFSRPGWLWVSEDIAKGGRERWVPIMDDLAPIAEEIVRDLGSREFVLPAQRWRDPGINRAKADYRQHPTSPQALYYLVKRVGARAGIAAPLHPHLLRHGYADHIAKYAGVRNAQFLLGHAGIGTTETYLGRPSLDELAAAVRGFTFGIGDIPPARGALRPVEATTGIEPV